MSARSQISALGVPVPVRDAEVDHGDGARGDLHALGIVRSRLAARDHRTTTQRHRRHQLLTLSAGLVGRVGHVDGDADVGRDLPCDRLGPAAAQFLLNRADAVHADLEAVVRAEPQRLEDDEQAGLVVEARGGDEAVRERRDAPSRKRLAH